MVAAEAAELSTGVPYGEMAIATALPPKTQALTPSARLSTPLSGWIRRNAWGALSSGGQQPQYALDQVPVS